MSVSDYYENKILEHMIRNQAFTPPATIYLSLHTADPGETGASEVSGGTYVRQAVTWAAAHATNGTIANSAATNHTLMPAATVTYAGLWDASTTGNFLWGGPLGASKTTNAGDTFQTAIGSLVVTLA